LFGTTSRSGFHGDGTVFELVKFGSVYGLITLVDFSGRPNGAEPRGSLIADANGNLFGTTTGGGTSGNGTVFELVKSGSGYAGFPTTLVSFTANGAEPQGSLIADANGNLFFTTLIGGARGGGTVFELVKSGSGYALTTLGDFNVTNGDGPR